VGKDNVHHFRNALLHSYYITPYWGGTVYSGMTLNWDYEKCTCDIPMPGYVTIFLNKFQHDTPKYPQHASSKYITPIYGAKTQHATRDETPQNNAPTSKLSQDKFYTKSGQYISLYLCPSMQLPWNTPKQQKITSRGRSATGLPGHTP
jgi:hypothetical protein